MGKSIEHFDYHPSIDKVNGIEQEPEYCFWESRLYNKTYFHNKTGHRGFTYYDNCDVSKFLFYHWLNKWIKLISREYVEPYKLHPLPVSDQILYWQPIFSKHVSDGLVRLEKYETNRAKSEKVDKNFEPYKSILFRASVLTFWKRTLFALIGIIATNILSMSISFLVKKLLEILNTGKFSFYKIFLLLLSIILLQVVDGLLIDNFNFLVYRLIYIIHYCLSITIFHHGFCYRRKFHNNVEGSNPLAVCNNLLHSVSPDSECSKNPLYCLALRYQNKDIDSRIFCFEFMDSYFFSLFFDSLFNIVNFLTSFIYGIILLSIQIKIDIWLMYIIGMLFIVLMICIEVINTFVLRLILFHRDYRISKCLNIIPSLPVISKMLLDDLALNVITDARNKELVYVFIRMFLAFFNESLYLICINVSFYVIMKYFVNSIDEASGIGEIDTAAYLTTLYIFIKIMDSMNMVPSSIKTITIAYVSYRRFHKFISECSPNFYISDNKFSGSNRMGTSIDVVTKEIKKDVMVSYKEASFAWVNNRRDLLDKNYQLCLKNINFELKRGQIAIVTGPQGSGKSNFIKSLLGEMTLVGGSMAVVPLHTSMPIFYASQDICLQQGTIRSNITFGYKFDEILYNKVLKAVELEFDISTWESGDMRRVSDNAHSLSGGQRVRMELARALYAYLVFSQVNNQYNSGQTSFLMCLDSPLNNLDPFVAKTIFDNLFDSKTGLLVNENLAVIMTLNSTSFDTCVINSTLENYPEFFIYVIDDLTLSYHSNFEELMKSRVGDSTSVDASSSEPYSINCFSSDILKFCSSGSLTRQGRRILTKMKYERSFKSLIKENYQQSGFNPYLTYISPSMVLFIIFIFMTFVLTLLDDLKFVISSNLSDFITKNTNNDEGIELADVVAKSHKYLLIILIFVIVIVTFTLVSIMILSFCCITSSKKIHDYCVESIFVNSLNLIKIKNQISKIITYLSIDIFQIDDEICYSILATSMTLIQTLVSAFTLFYVIPISLPFILTSMFVIYKYLFNVYIKSSVNIRLAYLETSSQINYVYENAISRSIIHRSFKREWELLYNLIEHSDYHVRCKFMVRSIRIWSTILSNWIFSLTTLIILVVMIFDKYTIYSLKVGRFGLGLSMSLKVIKAFAKFSIHVAKLEIFMCSIDRFQSFIPPGTKCVFKKSNNIHEEELFYNKKSKNEYKVDEKKLHHRRLVEFKNDNKKFRALKKILFKPKIKLIDITNFITTEHSGIDLINVRVYTSPERNEEGMILKGLTVSAHKSDIIGIIGRTGAGKTTLLSVLENTVENRTGQVLLDGKDLNDIPKNILRQVVGVLPQLPFVFKGWTVRRFLDPRRLFSDNEINKALDNCGLLEFVNNLHGGKKLDSVIIPEDVNIKTRTIDFTNRTKKLIKSFKSELSMTVGTIEVFYGDAAMLLSNSQLRTLSFARLVLYRYFYRMIIIDEPPEEDTIKGTDESDVQSKEIGIPIYKLLKRYFKHCTCFVTAHNVNVLMSCTSVWVIHNGRFIKTCKRKDILANESISNVIQQMVKNNSAQNSSESQELNLN